MYNIGYEHGRRGVVMLVSVSTVLSVGVVLDTAQSAFLLVY